MKGIFWTDDLIEQLKKLYASELTASQIATEMNCGLTRNAIIGKVHRLGLPLRGVKFHVPKMKSVKVKKTRTDPYAKRWGAIDPDLKPPNMSELRCVEVVSRGLTFEQLGRNDCRWPEGDRAPYTFCGNLKFQGSYCAGHHFLSIGPGTSSERAATKVSTELLAVA